MNIPMCNDATMTGAMPEQDGLTFLVLPVKVSSGLLPLLNLTLQRSKEPTYESSVCVYVRGNSNLMDCIGLYCIGLDW